MRAFSPTGYAVCKIHTRVDGTNGVLGDSFTRARDGSITIEYDDNGMEVCWDASEPVRDERGQVMWYDENGTEWPEDRLIFFDDDEEEKAERLVLVGETAWGDFVAQNADAIPPELEAAVLQIAKAAALTEKGLVLGGGAGPIVVVRLVLP